VLDEKRLTLTILFSISFLAFLVPFGLRWASPSGIEACKEWLGAVGTVDYIKINNTATGQIYYEDGMPSSHKISFWVEHDTEVQITWNDWRGIQTEYWTIECLPKGPETLENCIPFPKLE